MPHVIVEKKQPFVVVCERAADPDAADVATPPAEDAAEPSPVNTFWDLGHNDSTSICFHQQVQQAAD